MLVIFLVAGFIVFSAFFFLLYKTSRKHFDSPYLAAGLSAALAVIGFVLFSAWAMGNSRPWNANVACLELMRGWCAEERCPDQLEACNAECDRLAREAVAKLGEGAECRRESGVFR
ncbi:MAG: hypothetical protein PVI01_16270 [Gemmatimonadales bacterium]|jgi:hypothetical protein